MMCMLYVRALSIKWFHVVAKPMIRVPLGNTGQVQRIKARRTGFFSFFLFVFFYISLDFKTPNAL